MESPIYHNSSNESRALTVKENDTEIKIAIVGTPNVGKSKLFRSLTKEKIKIKQYGYTFPCGSLTYQDNSYIFYDLPGAYSLLGYNTEDTNASCIRDFICLSSPNAVLFVCDYYNLEENLQFLFQILEITDNIVVCLIGNKFYYRNRPYINTNLLSKNLGLPVIEVELGSRSSIDSFMRNLKDFIHNPIVFNPINTGYPLPYEKAMLQVETLLHLFSFKNMKSRWLFLQLLQNNMSFLSLVNNSFDQILHDNRELKNHLDEIQKELEYEFPKEHWIDDILFSHLKRSQKLYENTVKMSSLTAKKKNSFFGRLFKK